MPQGQKSRKYPKHNYAGKEGISMYHSLRFEDGSKTWNTWTHWHLIPSTLPVVAAPTATYKYIDIPGRDGSLDFSDYLVGRPTYSDRSGTFSFYVANEDPITGKAYPGTWASRRQEISQFLDGTKLLKMTLEDDKDYYYLGRFYLKDWSPGANFSTVNIEYRVKPYKYRHSDGEAVFG